MADLKDTVIGKKFHALTIVDRADPIPIWGGRNGSAYIAKCDCGEIKVALWANIKRGYTKSCGCSIVKNKWIVHGDVAVLERKGFTCIIDAEDIPKVKFHTFMPDSAGYWKTTINYRSIGIHRILVSAADGKFVDHKNLNPGDNRKLNIRECTIGQNQHNRGSNKASASKYKGVYRSGARWTSKIGFGGKYYQVGTFETEIEAAKAYDVAAHKYHGEFARTNF